MKILNLYACLGGNRYKWDSSHDVVAVELDKELARMYQQRFPGDKVIVDDAHQYLLDHYREFDFIWSSPPCPTHSRARFWASKGGVHKPVFPDMKLYEEILFLDNYFDGKWVIENVVPFYKPLLSATKLGRHLFWSNFNIPKKDFKDADIHRGTISEHEDFHKIDLKSYKGNQRKLKIARNLVHYDVGQYVYNCMELSIKSNTLNQQSLF